MVWHDKKWLSVALVLLFAAGCYALLLQLSPLPLHIMDTNNSGVISLGEAINAQDVARRPSTANPNCTELYWLKDGTEAMLDCD